MSHADFNALYENDIAVFVEDPLSSPCEHALQVLDTVLTVDFHDIVPASLRPIELAGLTPFTPGIARKILNFTDPYWEDLEVRTLFVVCPHGRARGNSLAAGLSKVYGGLPIVGSRIPESVNAYVVDVLLAESQNKAFSH